MNIYFLEYEGDCQRYGAISPDNNNEPSLVVSLSPMAMAWLERNGVEYLSIDDFTTMEEEARIGQANLENCSDLCAAIDEIIASHMDTEKHFGVSGYPLMRFQRQRTKIFLDNITIRALRGSKLLKKYRPQLIYIPKPVYHSAESPMFYHWMDSLYGRILELAGGALGIEVRFWDAAKQAPEARMNIRGRIRQKVRLIALQLRYYFQILSRGIKESPILFSMGYDLGEIFAGRKHVFYPMVLLAPAQKESLGADERAAQSAIASDVRVNDLLTVEGISFVSLLAAKIEELLILDIKKSVNNIQSLVRRHRGAPAVFFAAGPQDLIDCTLFTCLAASGIPPVIVQHGGYGYARSSMLSLSDLSFRGYWLSWGDGVDELFGAETHGRMEFISIGSRGIAEIQSVSRAQPGKALSREKKKVMFILPGATNYIYYWGGSPWTDGKLYRFVKQSLDVLKRYSDEYDIIIRPHGKMLSARNDTLSYFPFCELYKEYLPFFRVESRSFKEIVHEPDLFLFNYPTTILLQALATGRPIATVNYPMYYMPAAVRSLLPDNVYLADSEDRFFDIMNEVLRKGEFPVNTADGRFLEKYGVHHGSLEENMDNAMVKIKERGMKGFDREDSRFDFRWPQ